MKLHILFRFVEGPYGGGNQFLKALRQVWRREGAYAERAIEADCLLVNANPASLPYLVWHMPYLRRRFPRQTVLVRIDGPTSLVRGKDAYLDKLLADFIRLYGDGLVWQAQWSRQENKQLFGLAAPVEDIIHNAPDPSIFYSVAPEGHTRSKPKIWPSVRGFSAPEPKYEENPMHEPEERFTPQQKKARVRLIATSWSSNPRKGFDVYSYLDKNLDFSRYEMTFVGNSPVAFKNIATLAPVSSEQLANILRQHDLYLTASQNDPCSNALLEALACGLPAVARKSGGHPELIQAGGELFADTHDVVSAIERVVSNLPHYQTQVPLRTIAAAATAYLALAQRLVPHTPSWRQPLQSAVLLGRYYGHQILKLLGTG